MALQRAQTVITFKAGEASIPAGRIVRMGSANSVLIPTTNLSQNLVGITLNSGSLTGDAIAVVIAGSARAQAGTNLSTGDICSFETGTGCLLSTTTLDNSKSAILRPIVGMVLAGGSKSTMIEVLVNVQYQNKTAYS
jgi:hypothetical protein